MGAKPIPEGYHAVTPSILVNNAAEVISFVEKVFDAKVLSKIEMPGGKIGHSEIKIGDSLIFIADPMNDPVPGWFYVYVTDVDSVYKKAIRAGATSVEEPSDKFYGDRNASIEDNAGNHWGIATHIEDLSPEELEKRAGAFKKQGQEG